MPAPMKSAERSALGQPLQSEDHDLLVDGYRGFTASGTFIGEHGVILTYTAPNYNASNAWQILYTDTDLDDLMDTIIAAGYNHIFIKTVGETFTWTPPANIIPLVYLESDDADNFIISAADPDVDYLSVTSGSMFTNVSFYDALGPDVGLAPNAPRPIHIYNEFRKDVATSETSNWKSKGGTFLRIGGGVAGTGDYDVPGHQVENVGFGDGFWAGVDYDGDGGNGYNCDVNKYTVAHAGVGYLANNYGNGIGLYLRGLAGCTGVLSFLSALTDIPYIELYQGGAGNTYTVSPMLFLFGQDGGTFTGNYVLAYNGATLTYALDHHGKIFCDGGILTYGDITGDHLYLWGDGTDINIYDPANIDGGSAGNFVNVEVATGNVTIQPSETTGITKINFSRGAGFVIYKGDVGHTQLLTMDDSGDLVLLGTIQPANVQPSTAYKSVDGSVGATMDVPVAKVGGGTRTLHFKNGLFMDYADS